MAETWRQRCAQGNPVDWWARWLVLVYEPGSLSHSMRVPFVLRSRAEREARYVRRCRGLGLAVGDLRIPLSSGAEHLRAEVVRTTEASRG